MKRLSGRTPYLGKAIARAISSVNPFRKNGYVLYGPSEADPAIPDLRIGHDNQWFKILTGDPSSAGQPLQIVNEPFTITVHHDPNEGADYTTVRDAMLYCAQFYAPPELTAIYGTILIKSGHIEKAQTQLIGADLRWVELVSEDNDVMVDTVAFLGDPFFGGGGNALWLMRDCKLPVLKVHFVSDEVSQSYTVGFNISATTFTRPARSPSYYNDVDLDGIPGKRWGCSGFDINLAVGGGGAGGSLSPSVKFSNARRDSNINISGSSGLAFYGGDFTGYRSQASVRCAGSIYISSLPGAIPGDNPFNTGLVGFGPYRNVADFRKNPGGPAAVHDIMLTRPDAQISRRGEFLGTVNVPLGTTINGQGQHFFHETVRNPRMFEVDLLSFETYTRKELLPPAGAYRNAIALVKEGYQDDGVGANTLYVSDNGEWLPIRGGGLSVPNPPTFTDNGDGTFTLT